MRVSQAQRFSNSQQPQGIAGFLRYPMRVRDFRLFGFTDVLNIPGVADEYAYLAYTVLHRHLLSSSLKAGIVAGIRSLIPAE